MKIEIAKTLSEDAIDPTQIKWEGAIVIAQKTDASTCFCVDYRQLSNLTPYNLNPNLWMGERIDSLTEATNFSTMDANKGY